jgi:hypothetical protein
METEREWRRLERTIGAAARGARCFLVYDGPEDRRETAARLAKELGARESVAIDAETATTVELGKRLREVPGDGPVHVTGIEKWPGGAGEFGEQLNRGLARLADDCPRTVLVWARDQELNAMLKAGGDLHARIEGTFDLRPQERAREQGNAPAPPARPHIDTARPPAKRTERGPGR